MYSGYNGPAARTQRFFTNSHNPVTLALIVAACVHFVVNFFTRDAVGGWFACPLPSLSIFSMTFVNGSPVDAFHTRFWTLLTYPIAEMTFLGTLINCFWLNWVGGSLERSWGRQRYIAFLFVITLTTSLALWLGCHAVHDGYLLAGLTLPIVGMTVAWATINPFVELMFFIIKMKAWQLAALVVAIMIFLDFESQPILGLFALACPFVAYIWARGRFDVGFGRGGNRAPQRGPDLRFVDVDKPKRKGQPLDDLRGKSSRGPLGAYQDWRQRKKLEKLWRDSGFTDKDDSERKR
jgi:membrane associated rhomboid family serine protease